MSARRPANPLCGGLRGDGSVRPLSSYTPAQQRVLVALIGAHDVSDSVVHHASASRPLGQAARPSRKGAR